MSLESISLRHQELEGMSKTQSVKLINELKSQAHKDRGELLELCKDLVSELSRKRVNESKIKELRGVVKSQKAAIRDFMAEVKALKENSNG